MEEIIHPTAAVQSPCVLCGDSSLGESGVCYQAVRIIRCEVEATGDIVTFPGIVTSHKSETRY